MAIIAIRRNLFPNWSAVSSNSTLLLANWLAIRFSDRLLPGLKLCTWTGASGDLISAGLHCSSAGRSVSRLIRAFYPRRGGSLTPCSTAFLALAGDLLPERSKFVSLLSILRTPRAGRRTSSPLGSCRVAHKRGTHLQPHPPLSCS